MSLLTNFNRVDAVRLLVDIWSECEAPLHELNQAYKIGSLKYEPHNWQLGIPTHKLLKAAIRHYNEARLEMRDGLVDNASRSMNSKDFVGTDIEPASHYGHVLWALLTCVWYYDNKPEWVQPAGEDAIYND